MMLMALVSPFGISSCSSGLSLVPKGGLMNVHPLIWKYASYAPSLVFLRSYERVSTYRCEERVILCIKELVFSWKCVGCVGITAVRYVCDMLAQDSITDLLPMAIKVKCLSICGCFISKETNLHGLVQQDPCQAPNFLRRESVRFTPPESCPKVRAYHGRQVRLCETGRTHVMFPRWRIGITISIFASPRTQIRVVVSFEHAIAHSWLHLRCCWVRHVYYPSQDVLHVLGIGFYKPAFECRSLCVGLLPRKNCHLFHCLVCSVDCYRVETLRSVFRGLRIPASPSHLVLMFGAVRVGGRLNVWNSKIRWIQEVR